MNSSLERTRAQIERVERESARDDVRVRVDEAAPQRAAAAVQRDAAPRRRRGFDGDDSPVTGDRDVCEARPRRRRRSSANVATPASRSASVE